MHEMAIAKGILDIVLRSIDGHDVSAVRRIRVLTGAMMHIEPESLRFGFAAMAAGTVAAEAELCVEIVPVRAECSVCGTVFAVPDCRFLCPQCESAAVTMLSGRELSVADLEVE